MNIDIRLLLRASAVALLLAGAACSNRNAGTLPATAAEPALSEAAVPAGSTPERLSIDQQVAGAVADLASKTGLDADAVTVKQARSVNWGSGALGCPEPGMNYTQAIVPGLLVLLEADGRVYRYHGKSGGKLFHCPEERARAPAFGRGEEVM